MSLGASAITCFTSSGSTVRRVARERPSAPILALTANADPWDAASYLSQGMDGVVEKPIKAERLLTAINAVFADETRRVAA